jgi:hypothetical protein
MGTILASQIIGKARKILQDTDEAFKRHVDADLLGWLNSAQRAVVEIKPDAYVVVEAVQLSPGSRQEVPSGFLVEAIRNMGADGETPGIGIKPITRSMLDMTIPDWHNALPCGQVVFSVYDRRFPQHFYVYPPQPDPAHYIEIAYPKTPADIALVTDPITLPDIYENALIDGLLYRAFSIETEYVHKAEQHFNAMVRALGGKAQAKREAEHKDSSNAVQS